MNVRQALRRRHFVKFLLTYLLLGTAFPVAVRGAEECKLKIGALFPLTGPASIIGDRSQQAVQLSLESLPLELRNRISVTFEDTEMKAATGFRAAQKLLSDPTVSALTGFGSELVSASAQAIERAAVPGVFVTPDRRPISGQKYLFRHWVDGADMLKSLIPEMKRGDVRTLAVVYSEIPAMSDFGESLLREAATLGLEIRYHTNVLPTELDLRTIAQSALNATPEAVFFFLLPPQTSIFMRQLRALHRTIPTFTYINTENSHEVRAAEGSLEGVMYSGPTFEPEFINRFEHRFGEYPEFASGNVYDIIQIYAQALAAGACTREEMRDYVANLHEFRGALGTYGVTDSNDFRFPVRAKKITNGRFEFLN